jgi:hypothetical protein
MFRVSGSSKGTFFETCIITRMMTKFVLWHASSARRGAFGESLYGHLRRDSHVEGSL